MWMEEWCIISYCQALLLYASENKGLSRRIFKRNKEGKLEGWRKLGKEEFIVFYIGTRHCYVDWMNGPSMERVSCKRNTLRWRLADGSHGVDATQHFTWRRKHSLRNVVFLSTLNQSTRPFFFANPPKCYFSSNLYLQGYLVYNSIYPHSIGYKQKTNSMAFSPRANYTDWATATCRRNLVPTFVDRGLSRGQRGGSPTVVNLSFLDRSPYFSSK
jgi:hypothetical protein